jgi:hypothetical protein
MPGHLPRTNEQVTGCARSFGHPQARSIGTVLAFSAGIVYRVVPVGLTGLIESTSASRAANLAANLSRSSASCTVASRTTRSSMSYATARASSRWPAIEVFLTTGLTNARTEGTNRLIKQVKRAACGFRNRENYRRRVRLHCTRKTRRLSARNPTVPAQG